MIVELKVPSPGESITEVEVATWFIADGDWVTKDQDLGEVESDKATLSLVSPATGKIKILVSVGIKNLVRITGLSNFGEMLSGKEGFGLFIR